VHGSTEPWAEFCYNTYYHSALRTTPFQVVYGRSPPPLIPRTAKTPSTATVDGLKQERDAFLNDVHERLKLKLPDGAHIDDVFHVGVLKLFVGEPPSTAPALPPLQHGHLLHAPEHVLHYQLRHSAWHVLIKWTGLQKPTQPGSRSIHSAQLILLSSSRTSCFQREGEMFPAKPNWP